MQTLQVPSGNGTCPQHHPPTLVNDFIIISTSLGWIVLLLTPVPVFRWIFSASWLPQPLSLPASSLHQQCTSDSLPKATLPCLSRPLHQANLPGRSKAFLTFNLLHGLVGLSDPLLSASELTLIYFASHLAKTVSYDTVKLYLVAV